MKKQLLVLVVCFLSVGCGEKGPSPGEVIDEFREPYAAFRKKLSTALRSVPGKGDVDETRLLVKGATIDPNQTGSIMAVWLDNPRALSDLELELGNSPFWTSVERIRRSAYQEVMGDPDDLRREMSSGLKVRYVLIHRIVSYAHPKPGQRGFTGGNAHVEGFVYDVREEKFLAQYVVRAGIDELTFRGMNDFNQAAETAVERAVVDGITKELQELGVMANPERGISPRP